MNANPMVAEINRLIADKLAAGESIYLPEVGTLRVKRVPARRLSHTEMVPPQRLVDFDATESGLNLVTLLVEVAKTTPEAAAEIYQRWLSHTNVEGVLTIEGVGVLQHKSFVVDPTFDGRLNPQGKHPVLMRRRKRFDWTLILGIVAVVAALAIGLYAYFYLYKDQPSTEPTVVALPMPTKPAVDTVAMATVATPPAVVERTVPEVVQAMTSGHYYAVLGVYSTPENAMRAAREAMDADQEVQPALYQFGQKVMVAAYGSADQSEVDTFRRAHAEHFPELWLYRAR